MLADAVARVLSERKLTLRQAAIATGVPYSTIERMNKGLNVGVEPITKFALNIAPHGKRFETVVRWLRLAEKEDFAILLTMAAATAHQELTAEHEAAGEHLVELKSGALVSLPGGTEFSATPEVLAMIETMVLTYRRLQRG
jgi:predicted transcriptional regulator